MSDTPISTYKCDVCGEVETEDRPIATLAFQFQSGYHSVAVCHYCNRTHLMPFLTFQSFPVTNLALWREQLEEWVKTNSAKNVNST